MRHFSFSSISLLAAAVILLPACTKTPPKPTVSQTLERSQGGALTQKETNLIEGQAIVKNIDYQTREVQLKRSDGSVVSITVSPQVKRLSEIKKGDSVVVRYYESLAFEVRQPTQSELNTYPKTGVAVKKQGLDLPPGIATAAVTETILTVRAIDLATDTVNFVLPDGRILSTKVRYPENLARIKPGDKVAVTYREAMAVAIDPA